MCIYNSRGNGKISLNFNCQLNVKIINMCRRGVRVENNRRMYVRWVWVDVCLYPFYHMYLYRWCIFIAPHPLTVFIAIVIVVVAIERTCDPLTKDLLCVWFRMRTKMRQRYCVCFAMYYQNDAPHTHTHTHDLMRINITTMKLLKRIGGLNIFNL